VECFRPNFLSPCIHVRSANCRVTLVFILGGGKINGCCEIGVSSDQAVLHLVMDFLC
jgi:hypothetical protein